MLIDCMVYCYKAKCNVQWVEETIRKDVCKLNSKLVSTTNTQIEFRLKALSTGQKQNLLRSF